MSRIISANAPIVLPAAGLTQSTVSIGAASAEVVPAVTDPNTPRRLLWIQNRYTTAAYLSFDGTAATVADGFELLPGAWLPTEFAATQGQVNAIRSSGTGNLVVLVGV